MNLFEQIFSIKNNKYRTHKIINILGLKVSIKRKYFRLEIRNPFIEPIFRNDDVSFDSNLEHFKEFCSIFNKYGYKQLHGITIWGDTNCLYTNSQGEPVTYENYDDIAKLENSIIRKLSEGKYIGDNKELIEYINASSDDIALHGLYHTDYSQMSYEEQYNDIKDGLEELAKLFPNKKVTTFIAPYNRTNKDTYRVCKKFNLRVSAEEGDHLELNIENKSYKIKKGMVYRYHHHRFYPETKCRYCVLSLKILETFFENVKKGGCNYEIS